MKLIKKYKTSEWVLSLLLLAFSLIMLLPFVVMISTSLKSAAEINSPQITLIPKKLMFENYVRAFKADRWLRYFFNSAYVTVIATVISLVINTLAGFSFARLTYKGKMFLFYSVLLGLMVPQQVTLVPQFIMMNKFPLAGGNNLFGQGGIGFVDSYAGLILPGIAGAFGIFMCRQYYLNFPKSLDEAAMLDGCSKWGLYARIYIPLSKPLLASLGVIKMTSMWNAYQWPLVITNSTSMRTIQLAITIFRNEVVQWELLMAATTIVTLPMVIAFLCAQKYFVSGLMAGGVKE